jgi:RNA polymerase sigma factor (sigma-70 family)
MAFPLGSLLPRRAYESPAPDFLRDAILPVMTPEDERSAFQRLRSLEWGSPESRDLADFIARSNIRLVIRLANGYMGRHPGMNEEEVIAGGMMGLNSAIRKFDPETGYKFSTYAAYWIRQQISRDIEDADLIRIPNWLNHGPKTNTKNSKFEEYRERAWAAMKFAPQAPRESTRTRTGIHDAPEDPINAILSREPDPVDHAIERESGGIEDDRIRAALAGLDDLHRKVIKLKANGLNFVKIAGEIGGSQDNAANVFRQAVENIRATVEGRTPLNYREVWLDRKRAMTRASDRKRLERIRARVAGVKASGDMRLCGELR